MAPRLPALVPIASRPTAGDTRIHLAVIDALLDGVEEA
jgi:hypothetical protein